MNKLINNQKPDNLTFSYKTILSNEAKMFWYLFQ